MFGQYHWWNDRGKVRHQSDVLLIPREVVISIVMLRNWIHSTFDSQIMVICKPYLSSSRQFDRL